MSFATRDRAPSHARIFSSWMDLPTWRALSPVARALLVEILARFRGRENGNLEWPVRKAANLLNISKATAARALIELERNGWLSVARVAGFGGSPKPATYRLTMFRDDATGDPPSNAFEWLPGECLRISRKTQSHQEDKPVPLQRLDGIAGGTSQSHQRDTPTKHRGPIKLSDALAKSLIFEGIRQPQRNRRDP